MKGDALLAAILAASALLFASVNGQDDSKYEKDRDLKSQAKGVLGVGEKVGICRLQVSTGWRR